MDWNSWIFNANSSFEDIFDVERKNCFKMSTHLMIFGYSLSLPWESRHLRYITEASTLAGEYVFGSFNNEITDNKIVRTFCVGFHLSHGNSPLCGSSTGGCNIEIHRSPFYIDSRKDKHKKKTIIFRDEPTKQTMWTFRWTRKMCSSL